MIFHCRCTVCGKHFTYEAKNLQSLQKILSSQTHCSIGQHVADPSRLTITVVERPVPDS